MNQLTRRESANSVREIRDAEVEDSRKALAGAYDALRDAILDQHRQRVEQALRIAAAVPVETIAGQIKAVRVPATTAEILFHVTKLLAVMKLFSGSVDSKAFLDQLVEDLRDLRPSLVALVAGCRRVRTTCKTFPSIAEVLEAVAAAESDYRSADYRAAELPRRIEEGRAMIGNPFDD